jgi:CpeT protein
MLHFVHILSGHFSNHDQARSEPAKFSHINIFFRPLPWETFNGPWFYSEQSYDYDPWRPYRQGVHHMVGCEDHILMLNFGLRNALRCAGGGSKPELLRGLQRSDLLPRTGCAMEFRLKDDGTYRGEVEPGCRCLVPRDGQMTYLVSEVEVDESQWISRDRGFDPISHTYRWGSEHGPLCFTRMERFGDHLDAAWLRDGSARSTVL